MRKLFYLLNFFVSFTILISCSTESTPVYQLNTSADPVEAGSVTPSEGEYEEGEQIEVMASPNEHWVFDRWEGDHTSNENPIIVSMDSDKDISAVFQKREYPLTVDIEGEGNVTQEIIQQKTTDYPHGTLIELTAEPESGWEFIRWEGDMDGSENPITITIEEEATVIAVFEPIEYPLMINIDGEGQVIEEVVQTKATDYLEGTSIELTAEPNENWIFDSWDGDIQGDDNPVIITMDEPKEVTATFLRTYNLRTVSEPEEGGSITPDDGVYVRDTTLEIEATPVNSGWRFRGWEGDFSGSVNPFNLTMNGDKTIVANFERQVYDLEIIQEGEGSIEIELVSGKERDGGFEFESEVVITAVPKEGWDFIEWQGDISSTEISIKIVMNENKSINAVFKEGVMDIDGNLYETVKIGNYWWMAENLKTTRYRDGTAIPNVTNASDWAELETGAWVYYDNNSSYADVYGLLYNWFATSNERGLCPEGWRVPSDRDWHLLERELGMDIDRILDEEADDHNGTGWRADEENVGGKIKSTGTSHWLAPNTGATNESGLNGLPAGRRSNDGIFSNIRENGYWWTSRSASANHAFRRGVRYDEGSILRSSGLTKNWGYSIRCVQE